MTEVSVPSHSRALRPAPDEVAEMFRDAFIAFKRRQGTVLHEAGLSYSEWTGLHLCAQNGAHAREMAESIGLTPAGVTDIIDRLEDRGLVRRTRDPKDRRAIRIELTNAGRRRHRETRRRVLQMWGATVERLAPSEYAALATGLRALARLEDPAAARAAPGS
ncbi:MAG: MarR family transcriptional regulator [Thermoplasmata archaeon]